MNRRVQYNGGARQKDRMVRDKLNSLHKALLYSYQAETAIIPIKSEDQKYREFACLINPNKLTMEADDKVISIPFEDIPFDKEPDGKTSKGLEPIDLEVGDVIEWKETNTHWILYQRYLQERAYYRFAMRQCDTEIQVGDKKFWAYIKGPDEKGIDWLKTKHFIFNDLNYTLEIYISKTTETLELFQRFKKIKINNQNWEVQAVDTITTEGIIVAYAKEDYTNVWEEDAAQGLPEEATFETREQSSVNIVGPAEVYPYNVVEYTIHNTTGGQWLVSNKRAKILEQNDAVVKIEIITGKSGDFSLIYRVDDREDIIYNISILSL